MTTEKPVIEFAGSDRVIGPEPTMTIVPPAPPAPLHPWIDDVPDPALPPGARRVRCRFHHALAVTHWLYDHFTTVTNAGNRGGTSRDPAYAEFVVTGERLPS